MICCTTYHLYLTHSRRSIKFGKFIYVNLFFCIIHSGRVYTYVLTVIGCCCCYQVKLKLEAIVEIIQNNFYMYNCSSSELFIF